MGSRLCGLIVLDGISFPKWSVGFAVGVGTFLFGSLSSYSKDTSGTDGFATCAWKKKQKVRDEKNQSFYIQIQASKICSKI